MKSSLARSEFNIRQRLLRGAKIDALPIDALPADLQDFTAELLSVVVDAAVSGDEGAVNRLRRIAKSVGVKSKDPHQAERWAVIVSIKQGKGYGPGALCSYLSEYDERFGQLDPAFVQSQLLKVRSNYELAARLSLECGAFGDKPVAASAAAKRDAVARVQRLYTASMNEATRKKEHARK